MAESYVEAEQGDTDEDEDDQVDMDILAVSEDEFAFVRPCVDCGVITSGYCDHCYAQDRDRVGVYEAGQHTPLCPDCDLKFDACHYCRGVHWATPPPHPRSQ